MRITDQAVEAKDFNTLTSIFSGNASRSNSWQSVGTGEQRSIAANFINKAVTTTNGFLDAAVKNINMIHVMTTALGHLPTTVEGGADNKLRQVLFQYYVSEEEYVDAARILGGMRMEDDTNSVYYMPASEKTDVYVKIAECFLASDEVAESDSAVNKAGTVIEQIPDKDQHTALILRYKSTYARVLDANRKFLQAATRYHELSQSVYSDLIDQDDLLNMLGRAVTCSILAPSGPQRQRVLQSISSDKRIPLLAEIPEFSTHANILNKMNTRQILRPNELKEFEANLSEHQKAVMGDGLTIMERGVVEHNMIAVSNIYESIYISEIAFILGINERKTEKIAASMIMEGALHGSIDKVEGLLVFEDTETPIEKWDQAISYFCTELNRVTDAIKVNGLT